MRIEELVIDGFKSYPVRTHVRGFDPSFNAITGLNGSGKSNILDAICFVLGLTNLSSVRASNMQDLIYKRGQAGVTKASVTIVFDNSDKERSPVAFENYATITVTRQVAMGGASKYLINGHKATQQAVQNLFQSVQLNINNPNFLIMQGRITKVLNMKPAEILSMMEEATGTRMFEERKERAFRTMAKKDQKVREISALLEEEIRPKLDRLREEKRAFLEYQKATSELERLERLAKAHEWQTLHTQREQSGLEDTRQRIRDKQAEMTAWAQHIESLRTELAALEEQQRGQKSTGPDAKQLHHQLVEATAQHEFRQAAQEEEARRVEADTHALDAAKTALEKQEKDHASLSSSFATFKDAFDKESASLAEQESLLQTLLTGVGTQDTQGGFQGQLAKARENETAVKSELQQIQVRMEHLERELRTKEPQAQQERHASRALHTKLERAQQAAEAAQAQLDAHAWDARRFEQLRTHRMQLQDDMARLSSERRALEDRLPSALQFTYADPSPDFDRSRVKGLVASLVHLDAERAKFATALETCAGGRLYSVVVEDEHVGAQLLAHGQLKKRVTLIPLSKIQPHVASSQRVQAAQKLAPGHVDLALSLIGYEDEVAKALEYVFGSTLICRDAATAKRVTFDAAVRMKSVTMDGDVYDPAGTLSGGSAPSSGSHSVLLRMQDVARKAAQWHEARAAYEATHTEWDALQAQHAAYQELVSHVELKAHEARLVQQQVEGGRAAMLQAEIDTCRTSLDKWRSSMEAAQTRLKEATARTASIERDISEFDTDKEAKVGQVRASCKSMKAQFVERAKELKQRQSALRSSELACQQARIEVEHAQERLDEAHASLQQADDELQASSTHMHLLQTRVAESEAAMAETRAAMAACDDQVAELQAALQAKKASVADGELQLKQWHRELEQLEHVHATAQRHITALETAFPWILDECHLFGQPGSAYEFAKHNMDDVRRQCKRLDEQQSGLRRRINPRVMHMIDNVEKKDASLQHMLSTVLRDKNKIEQTIEELDRYKRAALQTTFEQVNRDFGAIFGELLPGNYAMLQPPEGQDVTQGLEVRVRLGATWKQSLTELSGGQRSLIALSLIMSLLQFNPAPMYILDEVDAALDLSHTQHIGHLFSTRFKGSQFIVVSLKEGLFSNANVLFRARFRDGTSVVERVSHKAGTASAPRRTTAKF